MEAAAAGNLWSPNMSDSFDRRSRNPASLPFVANLRLLRLEVRIHEIRLDERTVHGHFSRELDRF
jgi:hypothetical protein